jgi:hypothetical protein
MPRTALAFSWYAAGESHADGGLLLGVLVLNGDRPCQACRLRRPWTRRKRRASTSRIWWAWTGLGFRFLACIRRVPPRIGLTRRLTGRADRRGDLPVFLRDEANLAHGRRSADRDRLHSPRSVAGDLAQSKGRAGSHEPNRLACWALTISMLTAYMAEGLFDGRSLIS